MFRRPALPLVLLLLLAPGSVWGQKGLRISDFRAEVGTGLDSRWTNLSEVSTYGGQDLEGWLGAEASGYYGSPGFVAFRLSARPMLTRYDRLGVGTGGERSVDGHVGIRFLPRSVAATEVEGWTFRANRRLPYGALGSVRQTGYRAGLRLKTRGLPIRVWYSGISNTYRWDETAGRDLDDYELLTRSLQLSARNSKTQLTLERTGLSGTQLDGSHSRSRATLNHRLKWGTGSDLRSNFSYTARRNGLFHEFTRWNEVATLRHFPWLQSEYLWNYGAARLELNRSVSRSGSVRLVGIPGSWGRIWAEVGQGSASSNEAELRTRFAGLTYEGRPPLPFGLNGGGRLTAQYNWNDLDSEGGFFAEVIDEVHEVTRDLRFTLARTGADPLSVRIIDEATERILLPNGDYRIEQVGQFTEVIILPGALVQVGDRLLVSYRARVDAGFADRTFSVISSLSASRGGVEGYVRASAVFPRGEQDEVLGGLLRSQRFVDAAFGLTGTAAVGALTGMLNLEHRTIQQGELESRRTGVAGQVQGSLPKGLVLGLVGGLVWVRSDFGSARGHRLEGRADWGVTTNLRAKGTYGYWTHAAPGRNESFWGGTAGVEWRRGKTRFLLLYQNTTSTVWSQDDTLERGTFSLSLVREFR